MSKILKYKNFSIDLKDIDTAMPIDKKDIYGIELEFKNKNYNLFLEYNNQNERQKVFNYITN